MNAVCPGVVETSLGVPAADQVGYRAGIRRFAERIPLRRIGQPEHVASVVAFLALDEAAHVTGAGWLIDGGQTLQTWANAPDVACYPLTTLEPVWKRACTACMMVADADGCGQ